MYDAENIKIAKFCSLLSI